jgi:hypothetical protein
LAIKGELVSADKAPELLERILKVRDPELWKTRKENRAKARAKARRQRQPVSSSLSWPVSTKRGFEYNPLERLGLTVINRKLSSARLALYEEEMAAGRWRFSPDPIVITDEGYLVNGQHRLLAASQIDWNGDAPKFLVVWGVDKKTALLMDEAQPAAVTAATSQSTTPRLPRAPPNRTCSGHNR